MSAGKFLGKIRGSRIAIGGALYLRDDSIFFREIFLRDAKIATNMSVRQSQFRQKIWARGLTVAGRLDLGKSALFEGDVELADAQVGGSVVSTGSTFIGTFDGGGIRIEGNLLLNKDSVFYRGVKLDSAEIGGNIELDGRVYFGAVDLTASDVNGILVLGDAEGRCPRWGSGSSLLLTAMQVGSLQDHICSWDNLDSRLDLNGFRYDNLLSFLRESKGRKTLADRPIEWLMSWLEMQNSFNSQSYEQLTATLRQYGFDDKADKIMIRSIDAQRSTEESNVLVSALSWLQRETVRYGYENSRSAIFLFVTGRHRHTLRRLPFSEPIRPHAHTRHSRCLLV